MFQPALDLSCFCFCRLLTTLETREDEFFRFSARKLLSPLRRIAVIMALRFDARECASGVIAFLRNDLLNKPIWRAEPWPIRMPRVVL